MNHDKESGCWADIWAISDRLFVAGKGAGLRRLRLACGTQRLVLGLVEREADGAAAGVNGIEEAELGGPPAADKASSAPRKRIEAVCMLEAQPGGQHLARIGVPESAVPPPLQKSKVHPYAVSSGGRTVLAMGLPAAELPRKRRLTKAAYAAGQLLALL